VRILRTFFSLTPGQLGCTHRPQQFHTSVGAFNAVQVLGRGAFCTAFRAVGAKHPHQEVVVKQEILTSTGKDTHRNLLSHLTREMEILRMFGGQPNSPLPRLLLPEEVVTSASPFLLMLPVGLDLIRHATLLSAHERRKHAKVLEADLRSCLQFAHSVGVCHSDLRPANVIALPSGGYSVIDWGLGRAPDAPLHRYKGAVPFMHDELLRALPPPCDKREVPFKAEYDLGAIEYIVWAFIQGDKGLVAPWAHRWYDEHEYMIDARRKWIQEQSNYQATSKSTKKRASSRTEAEAEACEAAKRGKNSAVTVSTAGCRSAKMSAAARPASLHNKHMNLRSQAAVDGQERDQQHAAGDRSV
jgi:serine/threonine protein kinase